MRYLAKKVDFTTESTKNYKTRSNLKWVVIIHIQDEMTVKMTVLVNMAVDMAATSTMAQC